MALSRRHLGSQRDAGTAEAVRGFLGIRLGEARVAQSQAIGLWCVGVKAATQNKGESVADALTQESMGINAPSQRGPKEYASREQVESDEVASVLG
jgi:hypothetical protein